MPEAEGEVNRFDERVRLTEATEDVSRRLFDDSVKIAKMRTSFFEKLMLLAAGAFALTLTLLGFLRAHAAPNQPLGSLVYLETAWGLMLASILFGGLHNYFLCNSLDERAAAVAHMLMTGRVAIAGAFLSDLGEDAADMSKMRADLTKQSKHDAASARRTSKRVATFGILSMCSILSSLVLLLVFALKNSSLL